MEIAALETLLWRFLRFGDFCVLETIALEILPFWRFYFSDSTSTTPLWRIVSGNLLGAQFNRLSSNSERKEEAQSRQDLYKLYTSNNNNCLTAISTAGDFYVFELQGEFYAFE